MSTLVLSCYRVVLSCGCSRGRREGRLGAEGDQGPGEELRHDPRGHLQFRLHRGLPLLLRDGGFGERLSSGLFRPRRSRITTSSGNSRRGSLFNDSASEHSCVGALSCLPEIPSRHVFLIRPRRYLQSSASALCFH